MFWLGLWDTVLFTQYSILLPLQVLVKMPLFLAKREVYAWIKDGRKTIDVRKGTARRGEVAVFQSGANNLRLLIVKKETGKLKEIIRPDNFKLVIPSAQDVENALDYLRGIYGSEDGVFTAYHLTQPKKE